MSGFFSQLEDIFEILDIEPYDQHVLRTWADRPTTNVAASVARVNDELLSSYLVWDVFNQTYRLYKQEETDG